MLNSEHLSLVNKIGDKTEFTITRVHCNKKILPSSFEVRFSRVQNSIVRLFWAENQGNRQNFEKTDTSYEM